MCCGASWGLQYNPRLADTTRYLTNDLSHQKFEAAAAAAAGGGGGPSWEAGEQKGVEGAKEVNKAYCLWAS